MSEHLIAKIEAQVEQLVARCEKLEQEAADLRAKEKSWQQERTQLVEKNAKARQRVEAMIAHLKNLSAAAEENS